MCSPSWRLCFSFWILIADKLSVSFPLLALLFLYASILIPHGQPHSKAYHTARFQNGSRNGSVHLIGWNKTIAALSASRTGWSRESGSESSQRCSSSSQLFGALVDLVIKCPTEARTLQGTKSWNRRWICGLWGLIKDMVWPFSVLFSEILYN